MGLYILKTTSGELLTFGTTSFSPGAGQTEEFQAVTPGPGQKPAEALAAAMTAYEARCIITVDKTQITADGVDAALVTVATNLAVGSITLRFETLDMGTNPPTVTETQTAAVTITGGSGTEPVTCDTPATVRVTPDDRTLYTNSGRGTVEIEAS